MKSRGFMARARGFIRLTAGATCVLVGIVGLVLPFIPGTVLILAGCALLGVTWVQDLLRQPLTLPVFRQRLRDLWGRWRG